jgi:hypothetical protein
MWSDNSKIAAFVFSVLLLSILKYVVDYSLDILPHYLQLIAYASLPIAGGLSVLSFCSVVGVFINTESPAVFGLFTWIKENRVRNFLIGFLLTAYLVLIRTPLAANMTFLPYVEWVMITLIVFEIYTATRISARESYILSENTAWKSHIQEIRREIGRDLIRVKSTVEQFVDHGVKEPLLVYLALYLQRLGKTEEDILEKLSPLISYQEDVPGHKLYFSAFPGAKTKLVARNRKVREDMLKKLFQEIDRL